MRLIDADALGKYITEKFEEHYGKTVYQFIHDFFRFVVRQIRKAPTIDAVPVVRCKDCLFGTVYKNLHGAEYVDCRLDEYWVRKLDDYCSYGERKEPPEVEG